MPELSEILAGGTLPLIDAAAIRAVKKVTYAGDLGFVLTAAEIQNALGGVPVVETAFLLRDTSNNSFLVVWDGTDFLYERFSVAS